MAAHEQTAESATGLEFYSGPERRELADRRSATLELAGSGGLHPIAERRTATGDRRRTAPRHSRLTPTGRHALELASATEDDPIQLTGALGLLTSLVRGILETGLEIELAAHLGHQRWEAAARGAENVRNGAYSKRVSSDVGVIQLQMPRDRRGTFEPVIVPKHGRRLGAVGAPLAAIYASGLTRAEVRQQLERVTDSRLERETLDNFTDELMPRLGAWHRRAFAGAYPLLLIDTFCVTIRGGRVTRRAFDVAVGLDGDGDHELLGMWRRPVRLTGAAQWQPMLDELRYRGIAALGMICAGGQAGLEEAAAIHWPQAKVRPGVERLTLNTLRPES